MKEQHNVSMLKKQGSEWTNDLGQTFPAIPLYRCECSCGWKGAAWYGSKERAHSHYARHIERILAPTA
jgi:hypothetical protein